MTLQTINLGSYANDGTGDDLRTAFDKVNQNFSNLEVEVAVASATNIGTGVGIFKDKNATNLEFKSLSSTGATVVITSADDHINLESKTSLVNDTTPTLGADLNLNGHIIGGISGDVRSTIWGQDIQLTSNILSAMVNNNALMLDVCPSGDFTKPLGYQHFPIKGFSFDFNGTSVTSGFTTPLKNDYDFGDFSNPNGVNIGNYVLRITGNVVVAGNHNLSITTTGSTNVTFPTSGTLATTNQSLGQFASTTSAQLAGIISDKTGTAGSLVFSINSALGGTTTANNISLGGYLSVSGNFSVNNTAFTVDSTTGNVSLSGLLSAPQTTKAANATGTVGQMCWDANYIYVCTATDTWKRSLLTGGY